MKGNAQNVNTSSMEEDMKSHSILVLGDAEGLKEEQEQHLRQWGALRGIHG